MDTEPPHMVLNTTERDVCIVHGVQGLHGSWKLRLFYSNFLTARSYQPLLACLSTLRNFFGGSPTKNACVEHMIRD